MLNIFFLIVCLVSFSINFGMEEKKSEKTIIVVDLSDYCSFCLSRLSVKKGSIITLYCAHSFHALCYVEWRKCKRQTCYCNSPLIDFDEEGKECLENYRKQNNISSLQKVLSLSSYYLNKVMSEFKSFYEVIDDQCIKAFDYTK